MAIFEIDKGKAKRVRLSEFKLEKDLEETKHLIHEAYKNIGG